MHILGCMDTVSFAFPKVALSESQGGNGFSYCGSKLINNRLVTHGGNNTRVAPLCVDLELAGKFSKNT